MRKANNTGNIIHLDAIIVNEELYLNYNHVLNWLKQQTKVLGEDGDTVHHLTKALIASVNKAKNNETKD